MVAESPASSRVQMSKPQGLTRPHGAWTDKTRSRANPPRALTWTHSPSVRGGNGTIGAGHSSAGLSWYSSPCFCGETWAPKLSVKTLLSLTVLQPFRARNHQLPFSESVGGPLSAQGILGPSLRVMAVFPAKRHTWRLHSSKKPGSVCSVPP